MRMSRARSAGGCWHKKTHQCRPARRQSAPSLHATSSVSSSPSPSCHVNPTPLQVQRSAFFQRPNELIVAIDWGDSKLITSGQCRPRLGNRFFRVTSNLLSGRERQLIQRTFLMNGEGRGATSRFDQETSSIFLGRGRKT